MSEFTLIKVGALLLDFPWTSFNATFTESACNFDPLAPGKNSIIAFADKQSQDTMGAVADTVEEYLLKNGTIYTSLYNVDQYI